MNDLFNNFNSLAEGLPEWVKFLSFWILLFGITFYKKISYSDIVSLFSKSKAVAEAKKKLLSSIESHSLILNTKESYFRTVSNFSFGTDFLDILFKLLLTNYIKSVTSKIEKFIAENKDTTLTRNELIQKINSLTADIINDYEQKFLSEIAETLLNNAEIKKADEDTKKCIPFYAKSLFIIIIQGFNNHNNKNIEWIFGFIENLKDTQVFTENEEIVKHYLDSLQFALKISVFDAEKAFKNFNGNLSNKIEYLKGLKLWN